MKLDTRSTQKAMSYIIYMMMGSFFGKAEPVSRWTEQNLRLAYLLLDNSDQFRFEEYCEKYFLSDILPDLPKGFRKGTVSVRWIQPGEGYPVSVVFSNGMQQLRVSAFCGGKQRHPVFRHRVIVFW